MDSCPFVRAKIWVILIISVLGFVIDVLKAFFAL
jgi:hypothetical protein